MLEPARPVVYVDDSEDDRYLMSEAWAQAKARNPLVTLADGTEALAYLAEAEKPGGRRPGLAILDIKMPKMTGLEALERLRAAPKWKALPVVMLTASLDRGDVSRAFALGANGFLVKPSSMTELVELARALDTLWLKHGALPPELD